MKKKKRIDAFNVINAILLTIFSIITVYPLYYALIGSFNEGQDYLSGGVMFITRKWTLTNYQVIFSDNALWHAFLVTIGRTVLGTITGLLFTSFVAYAMSRRNLKFRKGFTLLNLFTMFFGGGLVPYYLLICITGLYDTFWVYIIPSLYSVYNMIVIRTSFSGINEEIHESALIDGADEFKIWWKFYMPLSVPILATVGLWLATGHWNGYFGTMIYTNGGNLTTLQYYLLQIIKFGNTPKMDPQLELIVSNETISFASIIVVTLPVLCFYPLIQKHYVGGIMVGSIKE